MTRILFIPLLALAWLGCSSTKSTAPVTAESAWAEARQKFLDGDYLEAEQSLDYYKLQFAGSAHSDSVQFLLGECNTHESKYLLAAYEFNALRRSFPTSPLCRIAQFNIAESYYALAPPSGIDQEHSSKAIEEYQAFLELYGKPGDSLAVLATDRIKELRSRIARKYFDAAQLYFNMNQFKACAEYCDLVQEKYYDSEFADRAQILKIKSLVEQRKYNEARREIDKFLQTYRASPLIPEVRSMRDAIEDKSTSSK